MNYRKYLKSDKWKEKKRDLKKTEIQMCWVCGSIKNLNVHHLTYDRITREEKGDLIYLCSHHHLVFHKMKKGMRSKSDFEILRNLSGVYTEEDLRKKRKRERRKDNRIIKMYKEGWSVDKLAKLNRRTVENVKKLLPLQLTY